MDIRNYIHHVLIEENPYTECFDVRDRPITYEDVATNISFDIKEGLDGAKLKDHILYWLSVEFGSEYLDNDRVNIVNNRIATMIYSDETKQSFFNG